MLPTKHEHTVLERPRRAQQIRTRAQYLVQNPRSLFGSTFSIAMASFLLSFFLYCLLRSSTPQTQASKVHCKIPPKISQTKGKLGTWDEARALAISTTTQLSLDEKVGILIGKGLTGSRCIGDTSPVTRLNIPSLCMNDGPAG
jgi:hypothetical protein